MLTPTKASEFGGDLSVFLQQYKYQPELTKKLDDLDGVSLSPELLNEIVLWKVNRYVSLDEGQLRCIDAVRTLKAGEHRKSESILKALLKCHGVDLAMASTILRFRNPAVFQIVDRHAYRAVYGKDYPLSTKCAAERKANLYFDYLDALVGLCADKGLAFVTVDRALYIFDKQKNGSLAKERNDDL